MLNTLRKDPAPRQQQFQVNLSFSLRPQHIVPPFDDVIIPKDAQKCIGGWNWQSLLAKWAAYVSEANAMDYVAGYAVINDYRANVFGSWKKMEGNGTKSADSFAPLGPYLILADNLANPQQLDLWLSVK